MAGRNCILAAGPGGCLTVRTALLGANTVRVEAESASEGGHRMTSTTEIPCGLGKKYIRATAT